MKKKLVLTAMAVSLALSSATAAKTTKQTTTATNAKTLTTTKNTFGSKQNTPKNPVDAKKAAATEAGYKAGLASTEKNPKPTVPSEYANFAGDYKSGFQSGVLARENNPSEKALIDAQMVDIPGRNFQVMRTEVTQKLYKSIMDGNPSKFKGDSLPVEQVSWYDAIYFCNKLSEKCGYTPVYAVDGKTNVSSWWNTRDVTTWLSNSPIYTPHREETIRGTITQDSDANGFRLPTVEEWEYAANGGQEHDYAGSDNLDEVAWHSGNSDSKTHPVAQKKPNGYGLYDMTGNAMEWTWDSSDTWHRYIKGGSCEDYRPRKNSYNDKLTPRLGLPGIRVVRNKGK